MSTDDQDLPSYRALSWIGITIGAILLLAAIALRTVEFPKVQRIGIDEFKSILYSGVFILAITILSLLLGLLTRWARELITFREVASRNKTNESLLKNAPPHPWIKHIIIPASELPSTRK